MTRIIYKIVGRKGELRSFDPDNGLKAEVEVLPHADGYIMIADETFPLSSGRAIVDLSRLKPGVYTPILYGSNAVTLEPIRRERSAISFPGTPDSTVRELLVRAEALEIGIKELREEISEMSFLVKEKVIF